MPNANKAQALATGKDAAKIAAILRERAASPEPCDRCGGSVPFLLAVASQAMTGAVLCDRCRTDAAYEARERALPDDEKAILAALKKYGSDVAAGRVLRMGHDAVRRARLRIAHKVYDDCPGCRLCSASSRKKPRKAA